MRKGIVCFFIALLLLSSGLTLAPKAFSQTQDIKIINYSYYIDTFGELDVVGEIQNAGPNTVNSVVLTGSVFSSDGTDQADSYTIAWVAYLTPQQTAPFYMEFPLPNNAPGGEINPETGQIIESWQAVDIANIELTVAEANATSSYQYPDLKITSSSPTIGTIGDYDGAYLVNGVIQNTGTQTAQNITVVGAFFNSTGTVVAVGFTNYLTPASLAPSGTIKFQIGATDYNQTTASPGDEIKSYSLLVQTEEPILQGNAPVASSSPESSSSPNPASTSSPTPSTSQSPSVTNSPSATPQLNSNTSSAMTAEEIYAIVIVIIVVTIAGAIMVLSRRKPHEPVKATKKTRKKTSN